MKLQVRELKDNYARFVLEGADPTFVNSLRRTLVADIPKMAIEDVEFHLGPIRAEDGREYESVTPLFDEIIAHRLGEVPLPTDLKTFQFKATCEACHGEGCPQCTVIYAINKKGPGMVYSSDLEPIGDAKLKPVDLTIPLVKLGEGQAMLVYATAVLGTGRDHAKWQAVHGAAYRYYPTLVVLGKKKEPETLELEGNVCDEHRERLEARGEGALASIAKCDKCKVAKQVAEGQVEVGGDPTRFVISFETDGSLSPGEVLAKATEILGDKFQRLSSTLEALE